MTILSDLQDAPTHLTYGPIYGRHGEDYTPLTLAFTAQIGLWTARAAGLECAHQDRREAVEGVLAMFSDDKRAGAYAARNGLPADHNPWARYSDRWAEFRDGYEHEQSWMNFEREQRR